MIPNLGWFKEIGASPFDLVMMLFGFLFATIVFLHLRRMREDSCIINKTNTKRLDAHATDIKELRRQFHKLDKGLAVVKNSVNGEGDHALNRDV